MKKPTEAIEWMKEYGLVGTFAHEGYVQEILAYIDSIPEWPADLTRERLEELASEDYSSWSAIVALRSLAAIAPRRGKRKVEIWENADTGERTWAAIGAMLPVSHWRKVGEAEIDA